MDMPTSHSEPSSPTNGKHSMHAATAQLILETEPREPQSGTVTNLRLMLHGPDGKMIAKFAEIHEKLAHLIIVREGLDQFAHVHPEVDAEGNFTARFTFPVGGKYRLFLDHKPAGGAQATATTELEVSGASPTPPDLAPNVPGRVVGDGLEADVALAAAGDGETKITFRVLDGSQQEVTDLQPYLGAKGHLVVISSDGRQYVHSHPDEGDTAASTVSFGAHFPALGVYKGWGQFQRSDRVHIVPFVVEIR